MIGSLSLGIVTGTSCHRRGTPKALKRDSSTTSNAIDHKFSVGPCDCTLGASEALSPGRCCVHGCSSFGVFGRLGTGGVSLSIVSLGFRTRLG